MKSSIGYKVFIVVFTLISFEILLRLFHFNQTWSEQVGHGYASGYNQTRPTWFYSWSPNQEFDVDQKDFKFHYKTNSLGIRERDTFYTDSTAARILCLGDSYTEGFGAPYDSSYPKLLESALNKRGFHNQVYNAGIASTDPFHGYTLYKGKLTAANPKYVFITFNSSDLTEFIYLGGMERFKKDGTVKGRPGPWYEPWYQKSYLVRFFVNVFCRKIKQNLFLTRHEYQDIYCPQAVHEAAIVYDSLNQIGKRQGFELMVVVQPIAKELTGENWDSQFTKDLFSAMEDSLTARHIKAIDMCKALDGKITKANWTQLSYANDCHYTPSGYLLFTNTMLQEIDKKYPGYWR